MIVWRPKADGRAIWCQFEHDNPEPEPDRCDCCCDDDWVPVVSCGYNARWLVEVDGVVYSCCGATAHGLAVTWAAELHGPVWEPAFTQLLKYLYPEVRISELVALPKMFLNALPNH